ncbi:hypothetical protein KMW28_26800 [Flammeovirga yaeyamensis]|uniref:Novel STAND NTPase 1 domain-containing protein n=1 Tax=Flammeovirga yaeyamensis TaxID=367791 RepID=A0AAX1NAC1_9BACT|nr:hypothetical protein [Flammeovirga yaeyamensis]MBB3701405.1 hypothetical protein [Flammeovirga yaeyamensis]NMF38637.1 hypothetical protein [Flammeovirga yaeyamensis]QWG04509.1 hypothetical protein KMW28_26800 [Flammeovirga yaeyamensis]
MKTSTIEIAQLENPFLGLQPFSRDKAHLYFGREKHVEEVVSKLMEHRFSAVLGRSGIGKSSFIFCGIFPLLESRMDHVTYIFTPGTHGPLTKLVNEVFKEENEKVRLEIFQSLLVDVTTFFDYYNRLNITQTPVMYIDQFEELFSYDLRANNMDLEIAKFVELIVLLSTSPLSDFHILLTMRSDFIGHCADFPSLTQCINQSQFLIPQMSIEEKKDAIVKPLEWAGVGIADDLLKIILEDLGNKQDQLPSMQHAMMRTFEHWRNEQILSEPLQPKNYIAVGGIKESLSIHANEIYNTLNDDQKVICEKVFRCITTINKEGKGVRNPSSLHRIIEITGIEDVQAIVDVIDTFRKKDRAFLQPREHVNITEQSVIDITHESLMRSWGLLVEWTLKETESIKRYLKLAEDAEEYQKGNRSRLRQPELQMTINWREEQQPTYEWGVRHHASYERTMEFLSFSEKEEIKELERTKLIQKRRTKLSRILVVIFLFLGLGGILLGTHAYQKSKQAELKKEEAEASRLKAEESQRVAEGNRKLAEEEKVKAQAEKQNAEKEKLRAEKATILAENEKERALDAMMQAEASFNEANRQKENATLAMLQATKAQKHAETANLRANRLQNLSTARAMALNSYQVEDNTIRYLLAKQAVVGYMNNDGDGFDAEFYAAFHNAVKHYEGEDYNLMGKSRGMVNEFIHHDNQLWVVMSTDSLVQVTANGCVAHHVEGVVRGLVKPTEKMSMDYFNYSKELVHYDMEKFKSEIIIKSLSEDDVLGVYRLENNDFLVVDVKGSFKKWQLKDDKYSFYELTIPMLNNLGEITTTFFDAATHNIYIATRKGMIVELSKGADRVISSFTVGNHQIWSMSKKGNNLWIGTESGEIQRWSKEGKVWKNTFTTDNHKARVNHIAIHPTKDNLVATAGFDGFIRLWDIHQPKKEKLLITESVWLSALTFSQDGQYLITGDKVGRIKEWPLTIEDQFDELSQVNIGILSTEDWDKYVSDEIEYDSTFYHYK